MTCSICRRHPASIGALCDDCADDLAPPPSISPEQIVARGVEPTPAALLDAWGRPHRLDPVTSVGRQRQAITILEPSISRKHAELARVDGAWFVRDLDSANGTFVDDVSVTKQTPLRDGCRLRLGCMAFYFLENATQLPAVRPRRAISETRAPSEPGISSTTLEIAAEQRPVVTFDLHEATGGGGIVEIDGNLVQVTPAQLEFIKLLVERMVADASADDDVRGFVPASELIAKVSLDSSEPNVDNVHQLVRRVRRLFAKAGIDDLIESRHGLGYRLRVLPYLPPPEAER